MHLFYSPDISGDTYLLSEDEAKHCLKVLRLAIGDSLYLVDGKGGWYSAVILSIEGKSCVVQVVERHENMGKRDYSLHIAIAPTKNIDRYEWFLEKTTEIGIDEVTPLICERSERRVVKPERLEKVIESAMKQSLKAYMPCLHNATPFKMLVEQVDADIKLIAHCADGDKPLISQLLKPNVSTILLVGPEGDFTPSEVELAKKHGFQEVSLGASRLRTETAGVVACITTAVANGLM